MPFIPVSSALARLTGIDPVLLALGRIAVIAAIPVAFALAVFRGGFARTGELAEPTTWLGAPGDDRPELSTALAAVLGDPSLELVFWVDPESRYVDTEARPVALPGAGGHRSSVGIDLSGEPIGATVYDSDLIADPELVAAAGQVVALGVDRERLTAALRASERSLRRSRERIVDTADRERADLDVGDDLGSLPDPVQSTAYLLVAEAVSNVVKHAGASAVTVRLGRSADVLTVEVVDDGVGGAVMDRGSGIRGLVHRADVLGGTLELSSPHGGGTTVRARVPVSG